MRERDIHNLIEQQNPELKQEIWEKICSQIDVTEMQPKQSAATKPKRWKWAAVALAVVCVVALSIVLPLTLNTDDGVRFCDVTQYTTEELGQTLKEYYLSHNSEFLFVDWYDIGEVLLTEYGHNKNDKNDIYYFTEEIINVETGETLTLSITDNKTRVDIFDRYYVDYVESVTNGISVKWRNYSLSKTIAMFEYEKHIYYLEIDVGDAKDRLMEIISTMIRYT